MEEFLTTRITWTITYPCLVQLQKNLQCTLCILRLKWLPLQRYPLVTPLRSTIQFFSLGTFICVLEQFISVFHIFKTALIIYGVYTFFLCVVAHYSLRSFQIFMLVKIFVIIFACNACCDFYTWTENQIMLLEQRASHEMLS